MKKSRLFPALVISLIIAIIFLNGIMIRENGANTETIQIHAIIDNSSDNRWVQFIAGMRQAAEDQNVKLTVMPTGHFADLAEEKTMIDRSVREGASGVILQLCEDTDVHETLQNLYWLRKPCILPPKLRKNVRSALSPGRLRSVLPNRACRDSWRPYKTRGSASSGLWNRRTALPI